MKNTARTAELIANKRDGEILDAISSGKEIYGTQSFDQSLLDLYYDHKISKDEALQNATSPSDMSLIMDGIRRHTASGVSRDS